MDVYAIGDEMHRRGWHLDRQQKPPSLHLMFTPAHGPVVEPFLADLAEATALARAGRIEAIGPGAFYGAISTLWLMNAPSSGTSVAAAHGDEMGVPVGQGWLSRRDRRGAGRFR